MGEKSGRTWIPDWIIDFRLSAMGQEIKTLLALSRFSNKHGVAWPSVKTMSEITGLNERTVRRHLRILARDGIMMKMSAGKGGRQCSTRYRLFAQMCLHLSRNTGAEYDGSDSESAVDNLLEMAEKGGAGVRVSEINPDKSRQKPGQPTSERGARVSGEGITEGMPEGVRPGETRRKNGDGNDNGHINGALKKVFEAIGKTPLPNGCGKAETRRRADEAIQRLGQHAKETAERIG